MTIVVGEGMGFGRSLLNIRCMRGVSWSGRCGLALVIFILQGFSAAKTEAVPDKTLRRVIYLHYDYMVKDGPDAHSHAPDPRTIRLVVEAFRNKGITLHIDPQ